MMHFIGIIIVFLSPINGQPAQIHIGGFQAPSMAACQLGALAAKSELSQRPGVSDVEVDCGAILNPSEKAA